MDVKKDGSSWDWLSLGDACCFEMKAYHQEASMLSEASTMEAPFCPKKQQLWKPSSWSQKVQMWLDASVIMPSPSCMCVEVSAAAAASSAEKISFAKHSISNNKKRPFLSQEEVPSTQKQPLWRQLLFDSAGLQWFREALGGTQETRRLFANVYTNIKSISKPKEVSDAIESTKTGGKCPPWAIIHVSGSDACMCSARLLEVPFQQHKRHQRNGVIFCFFGSRVFVSCMDAECKHALQAGSKSQVCYAMAKELESIHLGMYSRDYLSSLYKLDLEASQQQQGGGESKKKSPHLAELSIICSKESFQKHVELFKREASKRCESSSDAQSQQDLLQVRLIPADCICSSSTNERIWVEVGKEAVQSYVMWLRNPSSSASHANVKKKQRSQQQLAAEKKKGAGHAVIFSKGPPLVFMGLNGT